MRKITIWNGGIFVLMFFLLVFANIRNIDYIINSDFAAQIVLADIIKESNQILPKEWNFSTEIHISFATFFSMFLLHFISSWYVCYILSNILTYIVLVFVGYFLCKILDISFSWTLFVIAMFLAPLSYWNMYYYGIGNEYLTYFIYEIVYIILWLQLKKCNKNIILISFVIWSLFLGAMGMRYALACFVPALAVDGMDWLKRYSQQKLYMTKYYIILFIAYLNFILGIVINKIVLSKLYIVKEHDGRYFKSFEEIPERVAISLQRLFELFGYKEGAILFSLQGIANVLSILMVACIIISIIYCWRSNNNYYVQFVVYANLINTFVLVLTCEDENYFNDIRGKYFILAIFLTFPLVFKFFNRLMEEKHIYFGIMLLGLSFSLVFNSTIACMRQNNADEYKDNKLVIDYMVEQGVTNGYASFWQANINMYYSNGAITISPVSDFSTLELQKHISSSKQYEENQLANKYFIWFTKEEEEKYGECIKNVVDSFEVGKNIIYLCQR